MVGVYFTYRFPNLFKTRGVFFFQIRLPIQRRQKHSMKGWERRRLWTFAYWRPIQSSSSTSPWAIVVAFLCSSLPPPHTHKRLLWSNFDCCCCLSYCIDYTSLEIAIKIECGLYFFADQPPAVIHTPGWASPQIKLGKTINVYYGCALYMFNRLLLLVLHLRTLPEIQ